jgi:SAM-dependent methyltransferase
MKNIDEGYNNIAEIYDKLNNNPEKFYSVIRSNIERFKSDVRRVLEIACGTGNIIGRMKNVYECYGLDVSTEMIKIAKQKFNSIQFSVQDMRDFSYKKKFDVIFCVFDSINHLLKMTDWMKFFDSVRKNLVNKGLFIFDANTPHKFETFKDSKVEEIESEDKCFKIKKEPGKNNEAYWHIRIFSKSGKKGHELRNEIIREKSFDVDVISRKLKNYFELLEVKDFDRNVLDKNSKRVLFVCRKI